jgi:DMSO reductase family type II enzyme molybdopterin subunit
MRKSVDRRSFLKGVTASGAVLGLKYSAAGAQAAVAGTDVSYRGVEDVYRQKWTWDRISRATHGTNCAATCAINVFVKDGIVWREEQQAEYGASGDTPDYGPRGCQKGMSHSRYMYGKQRVLYPMKRVGERGEGKWERISWEQATSEIADRFIDHALADGPESISVSLGTQMVMKRASFAGMARFSSITGVSVPESFAGVGDLASGAWMTLGTIHLGDTMAAVYKSRCCLIWHCNPAVTRLPDAHFFWEAKYNGTKVIAISPEFTPTAMHASKWLNPKPGTDTALAMAMVHTILEDGSYDTAYIREQTDLPLLVRADNGRYLRGADFLAQSDETSDDDTFYVWDEATDGLVQAPGTEAVAGGGKSADSGAATLRLGGIEPALEGRWMVETAAGSVEVTTVFELVKVRAAQNSPEMAARVTGVHADVIREVAREFASAKPAMVFTGFAVCKWLHGDLLQRAILLLLSLTGNIGVEGGGMQLTNLARNEGFARLLSPKEVPPLRVVATSLWDYAHGRMNELTADVYGDEVAEDMHSHYEEATSKGWFPDYGKTPWKMGIFAGSNAANWRASGKRWRETAFGELETIVALVPDMGTTAMYADYVLPVAHHYERQDIMFEPRTPYVHVLDAAVPPLGESANDWTIFKRIAESISQRARERDVGPIHDSVFGMDVERDYKTCHEQYTMDGELESVRDVIQYLIDDTPGVPKVPFEELAARGILRVEDSETTMFGPDSPYSAELQTSVQDKTPYGTLTGRQQFYIDHEWFLEYDEALPRHKDPLGIDGYPLRLLMGHARHGVHSMWRDDTFLLSLQRGEPDVYINPDDASAREVSDGDLIRVFNSFGSFVAQAHVSAGLRPQNMFMYHGWDPMMFHGRQNFGAVVSTSGLVKPTSLAGGYGHLGHRPLSFEPNQTYKDFTCDFEKHELSSAGAA